MMDKTMTGHDDTFAHSRAIRNRLPAPSRSMAPVRWYGGKGHMFTKFLPLLPESRVYVEPYCGAASLFWAMKPRLVEVLNDLSGEIIGLFRVLQDPEQFERLAHRLTWTLYSLDEFRRALAYAGDDPVELAWSTMVKHGQGFGGIAETEGNWGRVFGSSRGMAMTAAKGRARIKMLDVWHERLTRVQLDHRDALDVIRYWDSPETTFYLDPPYPAATRVAGNRNVYTHEADDAHHAALVELLLSLKGQAMLSGYATPLYQPLAVAGWRRHEFQTTCFAAARTRGTDILDKGAAMAKAPPRTEVVWIKREQMARGRLF